RKAKNVPLTPATSTPKERAHDAGSRWPEVLTDERKDELMDWFDDVLRCLTGKSFTCASCAAKKNQLEKVSVNLQDIDISVLKRPNRVSRTSEGRNPTSENNIDFDTIPTQSVWNNLYDDDFDDSLSAWGSDSSHSTESLPVVPDLRRSDPLKKPSKTKPDKPSTPWLHEGYDIPSLPLDHILQLVDLLVEPAGVLLDKSGDGNHELHFCKTCYRTIDKGKLPRLSLAN
ncbi:hypothetical protein AAF712_014634, partial [Marasmius tenuissimus]